VLEEFRLWFETHRLHFIRRDGRKISPKDAKPGRITEFKKLFISLSSSKK
jgi:hypothetical protein